MPTNAILGKGDNTVFEGSPTARRLIRLALAAGDERLALDPRTGRDRYPLDLSAICKERMSFVWG